MLVGLHGSTHSGSASCKRVPRGDIASVRNFVSVSIPSPLVEQSLTEYELSSAVTIKHVNLAANRQLTTKHGPHKEHESKHHLAAENQQFTTKQDNTELHCCCYIPQDFSYLVGPPRHLFPFCLDYR